MIGTHKAHFFRYATEMWEEFDSAEGAVSFLRWGEDEGWLSSCGVIFPDGTERRYDYVNDILLSDEATG